MTADVEQSHLNKMKYLEACVKEALRLFPSVPLIGRNIEESVKIDDVTVPRGATAIVFTYFLHRNPTVWTKSTEFVPERFLAGSE